MVEAGPDFHTAAHPHLGGPLAQVRDWLRKTSLRPTR